MSERPQIKPATEGWKQKLGADGKPLLQFADVKKSLPATHWADMSVDERVEAVKALGLPPFRAKQISTHYFTHYTSDPADMTDLPAAGRDLHCNGRRRGSSRPGQGTADQREGRCCPGNHDQPRPDLRHRARVAHLLEGA